MAATTAQLNVRIDPSLKKSGDSVLTRNRLTPSDAVRALWSYLASNQALPGFMDPSATPTTADNRSFDSGLGLALSIAHRDCGLKQHAEDPWNDMTEGERRNWLADQMIEEMQGSCR